MSILISDDRQNYRDVVTEILEGISPSSGNSAIHCDGYPATHAALDSNPTDLSGVVLNILQYSNGLEAAAQVVSRLNSMGQPPRILVFSSAIGNSRPNTEIESWIADITSAQNCQAVSKNISDQAIREALVWLVDG